MAPREATRADGFRGALLRGDTRHSGIAAICGPRHVRPSRGGRPAKPVLAATASRWGRSPRVTGARSCPGTCSRRGFTQSQRRTSAQNIRLSAINTPPSLHHLKSPRHEPRPSYSAEPWGPTREGGQAKPRWHWSARPAPSFDDIREAASGGGTGLLRRADGNTGPTLGDTGQIAR